MRRTVAVISMLVWSATPAHADDPPGGYSCRYVSDTSQPPGQRALWLTSGPMYSVSIPPDPPGPGTEVEITCEVQLNSDDPSASNVATATSPQGVGATVLPPTRRTFAVGTGDSVYACTLTKWVDTDGIPRQWYADFDGEVSGAQCEDWTTVRPIG